MTEENAKTYRVEHRPQAGRYANEAWAIVRLEPDGHAYSIAKCDTEHYADLIAAALNRQGVAEALVAKAALADEIAADVGNGPDCEELRREYPFWDSWFSRYDSIKAGGE